MAATLLFATEVALVVALQAPTKKLSEAHHVENIARSFVNAQTQKVLADGTECDILTPQWAIEVDFAEKWYESVGQSLHYAVVSGRDPGIVLILDEDSDNKHVRRLMDVVDRVWYTDGKRSVRIRVWTHDVRKK